MLKTAALKSDLYELLLFGAKEARACIFPAIFFTTLFASHYIPLFGLPRYDFIFLVAVLAQIMLLVLRLETKEELAVLCAFHLIGLGLELFKTHPAIGAWSYPEYGRLKIFTVPLYSGFMYASVASYMCQAWRLLDLKLTHYPSYLLSIPLSVGIYLNFFTHHFIWDARWVLALGVGVIFWQTRIHFRVTTQERSMPLIVAFIALGFFIWIAENIATYLGAWVYPEQQNAWTFVAFGKISSWFLLGIISFIIVADLKHIRRFKPTLKAVEAKRRILAGNF